ncbi:Glutamate 5-kinase [Frankliniella fusca]|uniref:Glutamate 5-kinase n=1 Tax=Frankliniella fusca TaxID=407009 RepID=A0AAE1H1E4_9NEOP|nr:Glutamate 5-kinase [Frankliniella fusca]
MGNSRSHNSVWEYEDQPFDQQTISHGSNRNAEPSGFKKTHRENGPERRKTASRSRHHEVVDVNTGDEETSFPSSSSPMLRSNPLERVAPMEKSPEVDFCLVCCKYFLEGLSCHGSSLNHKTIRDNLLNRMYPFSCRECPMRFQFKQEFTNFHKCLGPSREFHPLCCFLCLLPFNNSIQWRAHMLSKEHEQKEKLVKDIAQREHFVAKKLKFCAVSTQTDDDVLLNNLISGTSSQEQLVAKKFKFSAVSTQTDIDVSLNNLTNGTSGQYFCSPCSVNVPKANVITHEQGRYHKKSCESWVSNFSTKSFENRKPQESSNPVFPSKECITDLNKDKDKVYSSLSRAAIEMYIHLERDFIYQEKGQKEYKCALCSPSSSHSLLGIFNHAISIQHRHKTQWLSVQTQDLRRDKISALMNIKSFKSEISNQISLSDISELIELFNALEKEKSELIHRKCHDDAKSMHDSSSVQPTKTTGCHQTTKITSEMKSLFEINSGKKDSDVKKDVTHSLAYPLQEFNNLNVVPNDQDTSITRALNGDSNSQNCSKILDKDEGSRCETSTYSSGLKDFSEIVLGNPVLEHPEDGKEMIHQPKEPHSCPNEPNAASDYPKNNMKGTEEDVLETLQEYFMIDQMTMTKPTKHKPISIFMCNFCGSPTCIMQNMLPHILSKNHRKIMQNQSLNQLERKLEILTFLRQVRDKSKLLKSMGLNELESTMKEMKELIALGQKRVDEIFDEYFPSLPIAQESVKSVTEKSDYDKEYCVGDTIVIGNSNLLSLQEEVVQACEGKEIDDFEYECETCGVVIEIFNNDVDLSMDMHIQNDPQHQLASAVPVERDAQKMSEMSKSCMVEKVSMSTKSKTSVQEKVSKFAKSKTSVIEEILQLEQKFVDSKPNGVHCMLCSVHVKRSLAVHHFLSKKHMTDRWASSYSDDDLQEKCKILSSLKKCNYAVSMLTSAISRIKQYLSNRLKQTSSGSPHQEQNSSVGTEIPNAVIPSAQVQRNVTLPLTQVFCPTCKVNLTAFNKETRRQHTESCQKALFQNLSLAQSAKLSNNARYFFCDICKRLMDFHSQKGHLSGQQHKAKVAQQKKVH